LRLPWFGRKAADDLESKSLAAPDAWLSALFGASPAAASGVMVTPRSAMRCMAVKCAVASISETVGVLPLHLYRRNADGSKERATDHPLQKILHDAPNEWTPAAQFREATTRDALLYPAGGFAYINRVEGKPFELVRIDQEQTPVTVGTNDVGEPTYQIAERGKPVRDIPRQDILHIPSPSLTGCGLLHDGREAIGLALTMEAHAARLFGRGARPSGLLSFKGHMTPDVLAKAKAAWQAAHGGENGGGTAVLPGEAEWTALTLTSTDAQFLELRKFSVEEIARLFRVPPTLLMEYGRATWANSEAMRRDFVDLCLRRWLAAWEGECRLKLIPPEDRDTYHVEFLIDDFVKGDLATRMEAYSKAIASRVLNPNEVRAMENRAPYPGGEVFQNPNTTTAGGANV
jgi:HK97 family phage portal protein